MFKIDLKSNTPIYEQIVNQFKEYILKGYFKPNDAVPSVRKLATMLEINPNTVAKAYKEMEIQNLIVTLRGKGTFISDINEINSDYSVELKKIHSILAELKLKGLSNENIISLISDELNNLERVD